MASRSSEVTRVKFTESELFNIHDFEVMTSSEAVEEAVAAYDALRHRSSTSRHCPEYNALIDVHQDLCNALPINDLFPGLISRRVISVVDKEKLCLGRIEQERAELFLEKYLHPQLLAGETEKFNGFIATMKESPKCSFLVKRILERIIVHQNETSMTCTPGMQVIIFLATSTKARQT